MCSALGPSWVRVQDAPTEAAAAHLATLQDAPTEAAAAYLATLQTTQQVLSALRKAYTARHRILANSSARTETIRLTELRHKRPLRPCSELDCVQASFSQCGSYLALLLRSAQGLRFDEYEVVIHEVFLYRTAGFHELARFCTGLMYPVIHWSPASHLCICQRPEEPSTDPEDLHPVQQPSVDSAAFVWDPNNGAMVSQLDSEASAALCKLGEGHYVITSWSPSCQFLHVHGVKLERAPPIPGWLALVDVKHGTVGYSELAV